MTTYDGNNINRAPDGGVLSDPTLETAPRPSGAYSRALESLRSQRNDLNQSSPSYDLAYQILTNIITQLEELRDEFTVIRSV